MKFSKSLIIIAALILGSAAVLHRQSAAAFSITPTKYVITVDPGTVRTLTLEVKNTETIPVMIKPSVIGVRQTADGRRLFESGSEAAEGWFTAVDQAVVLAPQAQHVFNYELTVPATVAPGSHYVGLLAESVSVLKNGATTLRGQLVAVATIQVAGLAHEDLSARVMVAPGIAVGARTLSIPIGIENKGNIEVPLSGTITVEQPWTDKKRTVKIGLGNELFAQASRHVVYQMELPNPWFSFKTRSTEGDLSVLFVPAQSINALAELFRWPGKYTIRVAITYGQTGQTIGRAVGVWYVPWWSIVGSVVAGSLAVWGYGCLRRSVSRYQRGR